MNPQHHYHDADADKLRRFSIRENFVTPSFNEQDRMSPYPPRPRRTSHTTEFGLKDEYQSYNSFPHHSQQYHLQQLLKLYLGAYFMEMIMITVFLST